MPRSGLDPGPHTARGTGAGMTLPAPAAEPPERGNAVATAVRSAPGRSQRARLLGRDRPPTPPAADITRPPGISTGCQHSIDANWRPLVRGGRPIYLATAALAGARELGMAAVAAGAEALA